MSRKCVAMNVLDGSTANSFWIIPCSGVINEHQQRKAFFPMESDLVLLTLVTGDQAGKRWLSLSGTTIVLQCVM